MSRQMSSEWLYRDLSLFSIMAYDKVTGCICVKSLQWCLTVRGYGLKPARLLCPWDSPGKTLEWVAVLSSRETSQPRDQTCLSWIDSWVVYHQRHLGSSTVGLLWYNYNIVREIIICFKKYYTFLHCYCAYFCVLLIYFSLSFCQAY